MGGGSIQFREAIGLPVPMTATFPGRGTIPLTGLARTQD